MAMDRAPRLSTEFMMKGHTEKERERPKKHKY